MQRASCPSCGAPIVFANKGALATVCGSCRTVVQRSGVDLQAYGQVGEIREDQTPLCIGTRGELHGVPFELVGRLQLQYLDGTWNEWHVAFSGGDFGWLAEAQGFFSVFRSSPKEAPPNRWDEYKPGQQGLIADLPLVVSGVGKARCVAAEGTLPFPVQSEGYELPFVDFTSHGRDAATLDFSDPEPRLFVGEFVDAEELKLTRLRESLPPEHPAAQVQEATVEKIACPSCGGPLERHTGAQAKAMYCQYCGSGIDLTVAPFKIFAKQQWSGLEGTFVPLGATAKMEGATFTVLAHLVRTATAWDVDWEEYLLHHPMKGYRWLIRSNGHFTWSTPMHEWPQQGARLHARGHSFRSVETNDIRVKRVAGELYWRVRVGDQCSGTDYTAPPFMLSSETTADETTWTIGEYKTPAEIWEAFGLEGPPPPPIGIAPNQPAPQDKWLKPMLWRWAVAMSAIVFYSIWMLSSSGVQTVAEEEHAITLPNKAARLTGDKLLDQNTWWLGPIEVKNGPTALEIAFSTRLQNAWSYFRMALYNPEHADALDFGEEISYYSGSGWSEGSQNGSVIIPGVKSGQYWLRIEAQGGGKLPRGKTTLPFRVRVRRGVFLTRWAALAAVLLTLPLILVFIFKGRFEARRRAENA